jgi:hypothetical protein
MVEQVIARRNRVEHPRDSVGGFVGGRVSHQGHGTWPYPMYSASAVTAK